MEEAEVEVEAATDVFVTDDALELEEEADADSEADAVVDEGVESAVESVPAVVAAAVEVEDSAAISTRASAFFFSDFSSF